MLHFLLPQLEALALKESMNTFLQLSVILLVFLIVIIVALVLKRSTVHLFKSMFGIYEKEKGLRKLELLKLRNPNWTAYQNYLGREIPQEFKDFYSNIAERDPPVFKLDDIEFMLFAIDQFDETESIAIAWSDNGEAVYFKRGQEVDNSLYYFDGGEDVVLIADTSNVKSYPGC